MAKPTEELLLPHARDIALAAVHEAGDILARAFRERTVIPFAFKKDRSLITEFDTEAEDQLTAILRAHFPSHSIVGEERGGEVTDGYTWVIDALDGTHNFVMKNPLFCTTTSLLHRRMPILTVTSCPMLKEVYWAEQGKGAYVNDRKIRVSETNKLSDAVVVFNADKSSALFDTREAGAQALRREINAVRIYGSSAFELCQVAAGRVDAVVQAGDVSLWDGFGPSLLVKEAGGSISDIKGAALTEKSTSIIAANKKLQEAISDIMK